MEREQVKPITFWAEQVKEGKVGMKRRREVTSGEGSLHQSIIEDLTFFNVKWRLEEVEGLEEARRVILQRFSTLRAENTLKMWRSTIHSVRVFAEEYGIQKIETAALFWLGIREVEGLIPATLKTYSVSILSILQTYAPSEPQAALKAYIEAIKRGGSIQPQKQARAVTGEELEVILKGLQTEEAVLVSIMFTAGLRISDALGIEEVKVLEETEDYLKLRLQSNTGKTNQDRLGTARDVFLLGTMREILEGWLKGEKWKQRPVFSTSYRQLLESLKRLGLEKGVGTHSFKRSHLQEVVKAFPGISREEMLQHSGHKRWDNLKVYIGPELEAERVTETEKKIQLKIQRKEEQPSRKRE